jgi:phosphohistidine swiveling domain-containing protein
MYKINGYNPQTGEYNDSLTGDYLWSSANTREASPDVMTPYTWSGVRNGFKEMILLPGYLPVGNICGRAYNNSSATYTAMLVLGVGLKSFDASSKELYGIDPDEADEWNVPVIPAGFRDRISVLGNMVKVINNNRKAMQSVENFIATNPTWCETQTRNLADMGNAELIRWSQEMLLPYAARCFWWMVGSAMYQSNLISKLRGELVELLGPDDTIALLSNVSTEDETLASLGVVASLDRLRRGQISRDQYLKVYGHRGPHEIELSTPRPAEDPNWIDEQLAGLEHSPADVDTLLREQRARYESALGNLRKISPRKFDKTLKRLQQAARLTRIREGARSEGIRFFEPSRTFALRAGALCDLDDDIFFLEHGEILDLLDRRDDAKDHIPLRKTAYQKFLALPQYPTIIMGHFDPDAWAADPDRRTDIFDPSGRIKRQQPSQLSGLPGSAGQAEGRVRIVDSPEAGSQLQTGEILVAVTTNVGWTPIFPRAAAVITDVGAPLSHAAIVARELGIPAVVGCFNATSVLKTGDRVRVDGGKGIVEIVGRAE